MILTDPDHPPHLPPAPHPRSQGAAHAPRARKTALPTSRTFARFLLEARSAIRATGDLRLDGEVNVLLTSDVGIRKLNKRFRGKNKPTDVLSFPAVDPRDPQPESGPSSDSALGLAGDLAISVETAARQAIEHGHSLSAEVKILILHGLLHLAGMDHEADSGQMAEREQALRRLLRLPVGLIERAAVAPARGKRAKAPQPAGTETGRGGSSRAGGRLR